MNSAHHDDPMYGWALRPDGKPVPIGAARRGETYVCPVCHGEMIPKMGSVNQYHFAHMNLMQCTPESVAGAVAGIWVADALRDFVANECELIVQWQTQEGEVHRADLLTGVQWIDHNTFLDSPQGNILLLDGGGEARAVVKLGKTAPDEITAWSRDGVAVVVLNPAEVNSGRADLPGLMAAARVYGGWWLDEHTGRSRDIITEPELLRAALVNAVMRPPHVFCDALLAEGADAFVLDVAGERLWLPPALWRDVVGGWVNRIGSGVEVTIQEWEGADGGQISLFYVYVNHTYAVALRAYPTGETPTIKLGNAAFRLLKTTALDVACQLVGLPAKLPM